jgi:transposase
MKHTVPPSQEGERREEAQTMRSFIGCDAHRKYSVFVAMDEQGRTTAPIRVEHERKELRLFLRHIPPGTDVAVEATGSWYWLVDELEAAGLVAHLAHPFAAKRMMGAGGKKTDSVDARCLATLLRNGTLPGGCKKECVNAVLKKGR